MLTYLLDQRNGGTKPAEVITTTLNGVTFRAGRRTAAHLAWTDDRLRERGCWLRVLQPCYNVGVALSKFTHDFDAVLDVEVVGCDWPTGQWLLRQLGWAAYWRHTGSWANQDDWHIHMISLGCPGPVGLYVPGQVDDYYRHTFGLANQHNTDLDKSRFPGDEGAPPWPVGTPAEWQQAIDLTVFDYPLWESNMPLNIDDKAWIQERLDAQRTRIVADLLAAVVDGAKFTVEHALERIGKAFDRNGKPRP